MSTEVDPNLISENLTELLQNTVNMTSVFYDLFINPVPMDVELKQWDNEGNIVTISIPNRAKDNQRATVGTVDPEGNVVAPVGSLYVNSTNNTVYVKSSGNDNTGWDIVTTETGIETYVNDYLNDLNLVTEGGLIDYLTTNGYTTEPEVENLIMTLTPASPVTVLVQEGNITLEDNKNYVLTLDGSISSVTLTPASVSDVTKIHRILVQLKLVGETTYSGTINVGTTYYVNKIKPDFSRLGIYNVYYEYDNNQGVWVCSTEYKAPGDNMSVVDLYDYIKGLSITPNLNIIGTDLSISNGYVSNYSENDYMQFPFIFNFSGSTWTLKMNFITGSDVTTQQNILNSYYGIAFAIASGHFVLSISSNGSSWDIGSSTGTYTVLPETSYFVEIAWDGSDYTLSYSIDDTNYTDDITITSSTAHNATTEYVGASPNLFGAGTAYPVTGTLNFNDWELIVNNSTVWVGMSSPELDGKADTDLGNITSAGATVIRNNALPSQTSNNGKYLRTNGSAASWAELEINTPITALSTSGTIALADNSANSINPTGNVVFTLPTITDNTKLHQILVQINLSTTYTINVGTSYFFNKTAPDLSAAGVYDLIYEYDKVNQYWVCGLLPKGTE